MKRTLFIAAAVLTGLLIGLGIGQMRITKAQKAHEDKIKEANRKIAFLQKKAEASTEESQIARQQCQADAEKLVKLEDERNALLLQIGKYKEQARKLDVQAGECAEAAARAKKLEVQIRESDEAKAKVQRELKETEHKCRDMGQELKQVSGEKQALHVELKKKNQELEQCTSHNAELCLIAEELVEKYKGKGLGSVILQKEPLTQINKVKLEQLTQKYWEQIKQRKLSNK